MFTRQLSSMKPRNSFQRRPLTEPLQLVVAAAGGGQAEQQAGDRVAGGAVERAGGVKPAVKNGVNANWPASAVSPSRFSCIARKVPPMLSEWMPFTIVSVSV